MVDPPRTSASLRARSDPNSAQQVRLDEAGAACRPRAATAFRSGARAPASSRRIHLHHGWPKMSQALLDMALDEDDLAHKAVTGPDDSGRPLSSQPNLKRVISCGCHEAKAPRDRKPIPRSRTAASARLGSQTRNVERPDASAIGASDQIRSFSLIARGEFIAGGNIRARLAFLR